MQCTVSYCALAFAAGITDLQLPFDDEISSFAGYSSSLNAIVENPYSFFRGLVRINFCRARFYLMILFQWDLSFFVLVLLIAVAIVTGIVIGIMLSLIITK